MFQKCRTIYLFRMTLVQVLTIFFFFDIPHCLCVCIFINTNNIIQFMLSLVRIHNFFFFYHCENNAFIESYFLKIIFYFNV